MADHSDRGSARVPGGNYYDPHAQDASGPGSAWGTGYDGEPPTGRASVPGASAPTPDDYNYEPPTVTGRASVGKHEAKGRASVTGPRAKPTDAELAERKKRLKKKRRIRRWAIFGCVVLMMAGAAVFGISYFWADVPLPDKLELTAANSIKFANGKDDMAGLGHEFRVNVPFAEIPQSVKDAVIAAEDQSFKTNSGVDFKGVVRAFWNNVTGGEQQGASTITQQYAGIAANFRDEGTYGRKAREAVMAMKLDDEYTKDEILGFYLDVVYMGRSAYGVGAASQAFFQTDVRKLDYDQAAFLAGQIKSPDGFYDPAHPSDTGTEQDVWDRYHYVLDQMKKMGTIPQDKYDAAYNTLPETAKSTANPANFGEDATTGFISHRKVEGELFDRYGITKEMLYGNAEFDENGKVTKRNDIANAGGYTIVTTIDKEMQEYAVKAATKKGEVMNDEPKNLAAALVAVDPKTGEVKAYYGGDDGSGIDKAGYEPERSYQHPMGSSFKIFTLTTAVMNGVSVESRWDGSSPREFPGRSKNDPAGPVRNSGEGRGAQCPHCTLEQEVIQSLNTPMYAIAEKYGSEAIIKQAALMGVTGMVSNVDGKWHSFAGMDLNDSRQFWDREVSFGQYGSTVQDLAAGAATLANNGEHVETHFVAKVLKNGEEVKETRELKKVQAVDPSAAADVTSVLAKIFPAQAVGPLSRPAASKTGTWERDCNNNIPGCVDGQNSNTSYVGYVPQLSTAVWVGDEKDPNGKATDKWGSPLYGASTAGAVWKNFMEKALKGTKVENFPPKVGVGDVNAGDAKQEPEKDKDCEDPILAAINPKCKDHGRGHDEPGGNDDTTDPGNDDDNGHPNLAPVDDRGVGSFTATFRYDAIYQREYALSDN
ncbi:penicillin-binding protein 1A [Actinorhabdospora filicis]|uniref:Penicillin-binding protein 1A n=1 Tax=Actinorhabdospora filicis TaxID=1785913 RepID=A0A9W6SKN3_9ACTN|nr:transglycosylase domain-containing protein [Actinorhabdospora filicis]GLZ77567.1 penicillin-binding protein 1A [Actinorhabdospora filicis]